MMKRETKRKEVVCTVLADCKFEMISDYNVTKNKNKARSRCYLLKIMQISWAEIPDKDHKSD